MKIIAARTSVLLGMRGTRTISYYLKYLALFLLPLTLMNSSLKAQDACEEILGSGSIKEMRPCSELQYQASEETLKGTVDRLRKIFDDKQKKSFDKAQMAWSRYRFLNCYTYSLQFKGPLRPIFNNICRSKITEQRTITLKEQYEES